MNIISKSVKNLSKDDYYKLHLTIINSFLPQKLTDKEIELVAGFLALDSSITKDYMFNTNARRLVREKINMTTPNFSNYIRYLINKGILYKNGLSNNISINEYIIPNSKAQGYQFKILEKVDEN